jgi:asparagine synthetase A
MVVVVVVVVVRFWAVGMDQEWKDLFGMEVVMVGIESLLPPQMPLYLHCGGCSTVITQFGLVFVLDIGEVLNSCNGSSIAAADADGWRCCCDAASTT